MQIAMAGARPRILTGGTLVVAAGLVVVLWIFPSVVFAHPGVNDAIALTELELPVVGATLLTGFVALWLARERQLAASGSLAIGLYLLGVAAVFVLLLVTVGNFSNDRFASLLFLPFVFAPAGAGTLAIALAVPGLRRSDLASATITAGFAVAFLAIWGVARGARDWLLAPYGFDILLLVLLEAGVTLVIGSARHRPAFVTAGKERSDPEGPSSTLANQSTIDAPTKASLANPGLRIYGGAVDLVVIAVLDWAIIRLLGGLTAVGTIIGILVPLMYFGYFWSARGQSIGMIAFGFKVRDLATGRYPSISRALLRSIVWIVEVLSTIFLMVGALGWLWQLWDPKKQAIHDKVAGTVVTVR
jgi:uncharacterized RDD family membrane protein YckC